MPVIDLNAQKLAEWFDQDEKLRVTIRKGRIVIRKHYLKEAAQERLARLRKKIAENHKLAVHSLFHGGECLIRPFMPDWPKQAWALSSKSLLSLSANIWICLLKAIRICSQMNRC